MPDKCREKRLCSECAACYVKNSYNRAYAHISPSRESVQPKFSKHDVEIADYDNEKCVGERQSYLCP